MERINGLRATLLLFICVGLFAYFGLRGRGLSSVELASTSSAAELSIAPSDEAFSLPDRGSSLFDKIFSQPSVNGRVYNVPFPFTRVVSQLRAATGGVAPLEALFPMGRSLQRVAAISGLTSVANTDPFFRYPRLVLGFADESQNSVDSLNLNLRGRFYMGFQEKAQLIEVISYNDEAGRFEYQVVRGYAEGQTPAVSYANRQLCLTCHQNQTPIFSEGPWLESNANPKIQEGLSRVLNDSFYQGAPVAVDITVPQGLDQSVKLANGFHAFHKMWQRLCSDMECRKDLLKQIFLYKLIGQSRLLLTAELQGLNARLGDRWAKEFPLGLSRPEAAIPNRDPLLNVSERGRENLSLISGKPPAVKSALEQVMALSDIPGEFEPARPRPPMLEVWTSAFLPDDSGMARLIAGYSEFFTLSDVKWINDILVATPAREVESLQANCTFTLSSTALGFTLQCTIGGESAVSFSAFFRGSLNDSAGTWDGHPTLLRLRPKSPVCDPNTRATEPNLAAGTACPQYENVIAHLVRERSDFGLTFELPSGLSLRLLDGRRVGSARFSDPTGQAALSFHFPIFDDLAPLALALDKAYASAETSNSDKTEKLSGFRRYVEGPALNRGAVMAMLMRFLGHPHDELVKLTQSVRGLKRVSDAPENEITQVAGLTPLEQTLAMTMHSCGACHYNRDNEPPAYLGSPAITQTLSERCARLSQCAPRMLYRLKMWDCTATDWKRKKSPMPPEYRFKNLGLDEEFWKAHDRTQLMEAIKSVFPKTELPAFLISKGLSAGDAAVITDELQQRGCEPRPSEVFEKLPSCRTGEMATVGICN
jgi:hypothetical protein